MVKKETQDEEETLDGEITRNRNEIEREDGANDVVIFHPQLDLGPIVRKRQEI